MTTSRLAGSRPVLSGDPCDDVDALPFVPFTDTLQEVVRRKYLPMAIDYLKGSRPHSGVLGMEGGSVWESALTAEIIIRAASILSKDDDLADLVDDAENRAREVAPFLIRQFRSHNDGTGCWEHTTWDTSVTAQALARLLFQYRTHYSEQDAHAMENAIVESLRWLYERFQHWENEVKYPFGPADVAQIVNASLVIAELLPDLYVKAAESVGEKRLQTLPLDIVQYLLHRKSEKSITVATDEGNEEVVTYWWDDYFSTAEVVEALARCHHHLSSSDSESSPLHTSLLKTLAQTISQACAYFEAAQVDGMWGNHIDTLRVVRSYVLVRELMPPSQGPTPSPAFVPEIHTTFKAIRWICDSKQIFSDGSFLHTLFLTVFYAQTLIEVHECWEPARIPIEQLYDDVVWFTPVRTTPERTKRIAAEVHLTDALDKLSATEERVAEAEAELKRQTAALEDEVEAERVLRRRIVWTGFVVVVATILVLAGSWTSTLDISVKVPKANEFLMLVAIMVTALAVVISVIWSVDSIWKPRRRRK